MQFGRLSLAHPESAFPPPYTREPQVGCLSCDRCHLLFAALASRTTTAETCWLGIWEGWGIGGTRVASFGGDSEGAEFKARQQEIERFNTALEEVQQRVEDAPRFEHPARKYILAKAPLRSACELGRSPLNVTPSLVWPDDRAWCVGTEIDFDSTLVAASEECVTALLSKDGLEVVRVEPNGRLDIDGDVLNFL